ncbi:hypothetical protein BG006_003304 [Podila minutissima]|uniref:BHLH domain-containing protein n=1 Tax=Podila minutissima TaxID=64525 RepID=A0A9P5SM79_9FUNG|nr:hypothetical protein BG006_003304 [Podila minutissima]
MAHDSMSDGGSRRGSMSMDHVATLTPTPSPQHPRSSYSSDYSSNNMANGGGGGGGPNHAANYTNGHGHPSNPSSSSSSTSYSTQDDRYSSEHHHHQQPTPTTPSPPLPSPTDGFQGRPLPPIEPSHPLHSYMSNSRRGSLADPEYHTTPDAHRPSDGYYANNSTNSGDRYTSSPSTPSSEHSHHYHTHPTTSPMQLRQSEHASGRRESLPSIHSSAGPLGQLLAQEPQRRHSIAHSDPVGPLKRKTSSTPLSQVHSSSTMDYPAKRRDSIPDAAIASSLHPYPPRSSYSAPSSPPRRGSIVSAHGNVPILNLQPAAEIKPSMVPPPNSMEHRAHFPLHQPRRPSLLSESSLSRRSSLADPYHHYHPYQQQSPSQPQPQTQPHPSQDYDHHMRMDMEKMHINGPEPANGSHLHPGYQYPDGGPKGDTPYSRSPELRVSHKLAERKRRKEMKELFDELRDSLPVDRSLKTSKWEILSKAVDYIGNMKANQDEMAKEIDMLRQEVARLNNKH